MGKILYYIREREKEKQLTELCGELKLASQKIEEKELGCTLSELLSGKAKGKCSVSAMYIQPEILIFCGMQEKELDSFLEKYREKKLSPIKLKAVVTPFNCGWSIYQLTGELVKESRAIEKRK